MRSPRKALLDDIKFLTGPSLRADVVYATRERTAGNAHHKGQVVSVHQCDGG